MSKRTVNKYKSRALNILEKAHQNGHVLEEMEAFVSVKRALTELLEEKNGKFRQNTAD